jgi:FHS family L-fucose permease-like MFS transporter
LVTVYFIYFFCGLAMCFEGSFNPEFKDYFHLSYAQQQYTTFAKNLPFALAVLIGLLIPRLGYKHCLSVAMLLFAAGTLLLIPGLQSGNYGLILAAFFILGLGFNFELVAGNPLLAGLGDPAGGSSRLNLGNALGAIAQIIAPLFLTVIIPAGATTLAGKLPYMQGLFAVVGLILIGICILTVMVPSAEISPGMEPQAARTANGAALGRAWTHPRVFLGFITIFLVLGAEAGLFGLFRNYVEDPSVAGLSARASQALFTVYFGAFALGRLAAAWTQKRIKPAHTLVFHLVAALLLVGLVAVAKGPLAIFAIILLGFFVSIFFPTLYSLAIAGLGGQTSTVSGFLTMGFLGCAVIPVLQGKLADTIGLQHSFLLCVLPYSVALFYALRGGHWQSAESSVAPA